MTESISYSVSFSSGPPKPPPSALSWVFIRDAVEVFPLTGEQVLVWNARTGARCALNRNALPVLEHCDSFRTLPDHAARIAELLSPMDVSAAEVESVLGQLRDLGLLRSGQALRERFLGNGAASEGEATQDGEWTLAIITCDRPAALRRLVEGATPVLADADPAPSRVLLIDDSRSAQSLEHNAALSEELRGYLRASVEHWDRAARTRLASALAETFPESAASIRWTLSPDAVPGDVATTGQGRNLATLLSAGQRLLTLDDDAVIEPRRQATPPAPLRVGDWPNAPRAYRDREAMWSHTEPVDVNPFNAHLRVLGSTPARVFRALGANADEPEWLAGLDAADATRMGSDCRVRSTTNATVGDPGTGSMEWLYRSRDPQGSGLADYVESLPPETAVERLTWRGRPGPLLALDEALMTTTLTGLDNRDPLPCVLPFGRSEDRCLSDAIAAIDRGALSLAFPWALPHLPETPRHWRRADLARAAPAKTPDNALAQVVYALGAELRGFNPDSRQSALANALTQLAHAPGAALVEAVERPGLREVAARLGRLQQARAETPEGAWASDLDALISWRGAGISGAPRRGDDWYQGFRLQAGHYGSALEIWRRLWSVCRERREDLVRRVLTE